MKSLSRVRKILSKVVWQFKGKNSESFVFFFPPQPQTSSFDFSSLYLVSFFPFFQISGDHT